MEDHLVPSRVRGSVVVAALVLVGGLGTFGAGPAASLAPAQETGDSPHPSRVTPDAAERRIAGCMLGLPTRAAPGVHDAWTTRCRARVAAGKL